MPFSLQPQMRRNQFIAGHANKLLWKYTSQGALYLLAQSTTVYKLD